MRARRGCAEGGIGVSPSEQSETVRDRCLFRTTSETKRLVVFADIGQIAPAVLLPALADVVALRRDVRLVAVYLVRPVAGMLRLFATRGARRMQVLLGSGRWERALDAVAADPVAAIAGRGIPVRWLPSGDPNAPSVLASLREEFVGSCGLNLYCMHRFRLPLLAALGRTINYHNGALPGMRGVRASNWSIYLGHSHSGYAFHEMSEALDDGRILIEGEVELVRGESPADLELRKALEAVARLPALVDAIASDAVGREQTGVVGYFSRADWLRICRVDEPGSLDEGEWFRRIEAFLKVETVIEGRHVQVTGIRRARPGTRPGFMTSDGQWLQVTAIAFWPAWASRLGLAGGSH